LWEPIGADSGPPAEAGLLLETSGSTGLPKSVLHSWASLLDSVAIRNELAESRWMTLYPVSRFAGLNTVLHASANRALLVIPTALTPHSIGDHLLTWRPTHLSGTPTLWRTLLMQVSLNGGWCERVFQITLGGETVDQAILDLLRRTFPQARLTHIYGSTEAGVCLSVSDGLAGFPAAWLDNEERHVQLRVDNSGELLVRRNGPRSNRLEEAVDGWWRTGDLVRAEGDRVFFLGRDSDIINVGGAKVSPAVVEACLMAVPGVAAARVFARKSSIAGSIVAAEVVPTQDAGQADLQLRIFQRCRAHLAAHAVPRSIQFVAELPVASSGKIARRDQVITNE
jgi:acyl-coenzyme A synthetase/AMP-(fatty) acid ligase